MEKKVGYIRVKKWKMDQIKKEADKLRGKGVKRENIYIDIDIESDDDTRTEIQSEFGNMESEDIIVIQESTKSSRTIRKLNEFISYCIDNNINIIFSDMVNGGERTGAKIIRN